MKRYYPEDDSEIELTKLGKQRRAFQADTSYRSLKAHQTFDQTYRLVYLIRFKLRPLTNFDMLFPNMIPLLVSNVQLKSHVVGDKPSLRSALKKKTLIALLL